ncbi:hypothetical protein ALI144C_00165 [Actinosynnema sp. ALI-1.44]|uniref:hypothetical protein n=1 Tax=Actinosynnema sp. ALI-1.44 TaxID=1933779 RepID=UPI00097BA84B|nr:hypothetical protein [Actinosynnema sp. ALI-1.44]ONI92075.1 hypothetical protein ALI144C_00165 [Actinosynnema sp. ALI-1.44]
MIVITAAFMTVLAGCADSSPQGASQAVQPEVRLQTNIKTVTDLFPKIAGIKDVAWLEEVLNPEDPRAPGPPIHEFQALIHLDDAAKQKLKGAATDWKPAKPDWMAAVHPLLNPKIAAPGSWVQSDAYSREFNSTSRYYGGFTVNLTEGVLYFNGGT